MDGDPQRGRRLGPGGAPGHHHPLPAAPWSRRWPTPGPRVWVTYEAVDHRRRRARATPASTTPAGCATRWCPFCGGPRRTEGGRAPQEQRPGEGGRGAAQPGGPARRPARWVVTSPWAWSPVGTGAGPARPPPTTGLPCWGPGASAPRRPWRRSTRPGRGRASTGRPLPPPGAPAWVSSWGAPAQPGGAGHAGQRVLPRAAASWCHRLGIDPRTRRPSATRITTWSCWIRRRHGGDGQRHPRRVMALAHAAPTPRAPHASSVAPSHREDSSARVPGFLVDVREGPGALSLAGGLRLELLHASTGTPGQRGDDRLAGGAGPRWPGSPTPSSAPSAGRPAGPTPHRVRPRPGPADGGPNQLRLIDVRPDVRPVGVQIFGAEPEEMARAAAGGGADGA